MEKPDTGEAFMSWITGLQALAHSTPLYRFLNKEQWHPQRAAEALESASLGKVAPPSPAPGEGYNLLALGRARLLLETWTNVIQTFEQHP